jgi:hypothetical protein
MTKWLVGLGLGVVLLAGGLTGCGSDTGGGGNKDMSEAVGVKPEDPSYGEASSALMNKMNPPPTPAKRK